MKFPVQQKKRVITLNKPRYPNMRNLHWLARKQGYLLEMVYSKKWYLKKPGQCPLGPFTIAGVERYLEMFKPTPPLLDKIINRSKCL